MHTIAVTEVDHRNLSEMIRRRRTQRDNERQYLDALDRELARARTVAEDQTPDGVVTMNSTVRLRTRPGDGESTTVTLVYPDEADFDAGRISVLAPLGTALLGYRVGDIVDWEMPGGSHQIEIQAILFQPQAAAVEHCREVSP